MVEHNLAKVGVASSNLVSRSIFFLFFLPLFLHAKTVQLQPEYCVDGEQLLLSHIVSEMPKTPLMRLPNTSSFQVPFLRLEALLKEHNITSEDTSSGGIITLRRHCGVSHEFGALEQAVREAFEEMYAGIAIEQIVLAPQSVLPADFKDYSLMSVRLGNVRSASGTFSVVFSDARGLRRNFYFRFHITATLSGFKAKHNLPNGKILTLGDIEPVQFVLETLPSPPLQEMKPDTLVARQHIREGTLLLERQFDQRLLVTRRSAVEALMEDGGLVVSVRAQALEGGNEGDMIRIRTNEGRLFKAKILSKNRVIIKE